VRDNLDEAWKAKRYSHKINCYTDIDYRKEMLLPEYEREVCRWNFIKKFDPELVGTV
jgi:hypothetical protein